MENPIDDKLVAIICTTIICCVAMGVMDTNAKEIIIPVVTGIFGVVTGASIKK